MGRFAPSPSGSLHLGSLVAALGSYLDARHQGGRWLVRIEDIDPLRTRPGAADEILATLESFGLTWDGEVAHQSRRTALYERALAQLTAQGVTYPCSCSRRELVSDSHPGVYPGTCRLGPARPDGPTSIRFRVDSAARIRFEDGLQGLQEPALAELGDVILRRRDGVFAYQLAVVADDAAQGVTHVVRGADLLASTAWQVALQQALGLPTPRYSHLPVVLDHDGEKLSKSRRSLPAGPGAAGPASAGPGAAAPRTAGHRAAGSPASSAQLTAALCLLRLPPPAELTGAPPGQLLEWAIPRWPPAGLARLREIHAGS